MTIVLVEQQPHINRTMCMVHDIVLSVFCDSECHEIHPSKKNTYKPEVEGLEKGKSTKRNTKAIARGYMSEADWNAIGTKKDDIADSIVQFLYWDKERKKIWKYE